MFGEARVIVMIKTPVTGMFEGEYASFAIDNLGDDADFLWGIFAEEHEDTAMIHLQLTTNKVVEDWQYHAIFDHYESEKFSGIVNSFSELENTGNPAWELTFTATPASLAEKVRMLLSIHRDELLEIYEAISGMEGEYYERAEP